MRISHTIKNLYVLSEGRLDLINNEVDVRTKPISKNFKDDLEDDIENTNRSELIVHRNTLFLHNESNQSIVKTSKVHNANVELVEKEENIWFNKIPKFLKKYNRKPIWAGAFLV